MFKFSEYKLYKEVESVRGKKYHTRDEGYLHF